MKVIGAGLGGTGTLQAKAALEALGFGPCYQVAEVAEHPEQAQLWQLIAQGESVDWEALFGSYESCVDFPACVFYGDLMEVYPSAKVLLTVRDPEQSYDRVGKTIFKLSTASDSPLPRALREAFAAIVWNGLFGGRFEDREHAIDVFRRWVDQVSTRVDADRLLVFDVAEGWEPLAGFLGVGAPDLPFPA
jgi:Sulfotransferase domain